MMVKQRDTQKERLYFLEFLAFFTGQVSRKDLTSRFGISDAAATKDLSEYARLAPDRIEYDLRKKHYRYSSGSPCFSHNVEQALYALSGERAIAIDHGHAERIPSWVHSDIKRSLSFDKVSKITRGIYQKQEIEAAYFSLSTGQAKRRLSPLALINDGLRWHVRCFDHIKESYRDFNLSRFLSVEDGAASSAQIDADEGWNRNVTLKLRPHPKAEHPETIRFDYDISGEFKAIEIKLCLVGYFLRHWNIDYSDDAKGNPRAHQLHLMNKIELLAAGVDEWAFNA